MFQFIKRLFRKKQKVVDITPMVLESERECVHNASKTPYIESKPEFSKTTHKNKEVPNTAIWSKLGRITYLSQHGRTWRVRKKNRKRIERYERKTRTIR